MAFWCDFRKFGYQLRNACHGALVNGAVLALVDRPIQCQPFDPGAWNKRQPVTRLLLLVESHENFNRDLKR